MIISIKRKKIDRLILEEQWIKINSEIKDEYSRKAESKLRTVKYTNTPSPHFIGALKTGFVFGVNLRLRLMDHQYQRLENLMLELVKRKPQEDILGLLNTDDGYRDAK